MLQHAVYCIYEGVYPENKKQKYDLTASSPVSWMCNCADMILAEAWACVGDHNGQYVHIENHAFIFVSLFYLSVVDTSTWSLF